MNDKDPAVQHNPSGAFAHTWCLEKKSKSVPSNQKEQDYQQSLSKYEVQDGLDTGE
jgi:hypothetical protein